MSPRPILDMQMTENRHLWACALEVERQHGEDASSFALQRANELEALGAFEGARAWRAIHLRIGVLGAGGDCAWQ
ncbi:hypothetical protein KRR38_08995 [Novosphingobium sp. G106]|uniref:DUF6961 family protein n=1 Tax=Novosphingobium sp. G106 TaxID=2849500 RepID=UPI001C2D5DE1|nr:hypothetical protein [Novosphingobium sp. G106]MBV1687807.1 hypothetical protein [Novosphingobium sp. G106]